MRDERGQRCTHRTQTHVGTNGAPVLDAFAPPCALRRRAGGRSHAHGLPGAGGLVGTRGTHRCPAGSAAARGTVRGAYPRGDPPVVAGERVAVTPEGARPLMLNVVPR